jgi:hypothetical protein
MGFLALAFSVLIAALGAIGIVYPEEIHSAARILQAPTALYVAAGGRVVFGVALLLAAPASRAPSALRVLGVVLTVAGIAMPILGADGYRSLVDWKLGLIQREWAVSALLCGLLLAYALVPRSRSTDNGLTAGPE